MHTLTLLLALYGATPCEATNYPRYAFDYHRTTAQHEFCGPTLQQDEIDASSDAEPE